MVFLPDILRGSNLYFLRHGLAGQNGDPKYREDSLRPLTSQGMDKMRLEALGMQVLGLKFDAILSSPYLRGRQTAEIVSQVYKKKIKTVYFTNALLPPSSINKLLKEISAQFPRSKDILLVGHEPHLTEMISSLLKSNKPLDIELKKGGLCCLSIQQSSETPSAILNWLLTPAQLVSLAKEKQ